MPSVQTDPALLSKKDSSIDRVVEQAGSQVGAGAKTKYLIKEVAEQLDARSRRKSGALMTVIGALVLLLLAAGAICRVVRDGAAEERRKGERATQRRRESARKGNRRHPQGCRFYESLQRRWPRWRRYGRPSGVSRKEARRSCQKKYGGSSRV